MRARRFVTTTKRGSIASLDRKGVGERVNLLTPFRDPDILVPPFLSSHCGLALASFLANPARRFHQLLAVSAGSLDLLLK